MAHFIRLELHGVPSDDAERGDLYGRLHAAMATNDFDRCVDDPNGMPVQLPDATYMYRGSETDKRAVGSLAVAVAWRAQGRDKFKRPGVVVTTCDEDAYVDGLGPCLDG